MSGGFGAGFLKGMIISMIVAGTVSLIAPLEPVDPGQSSQVDLATPAGSGFNAERTDTNPSLPDTDQTVVTEPVQKPETADAGPVAPVTDTSPADLPQTGGDAALADPAPAEDEVAMITPPSDTAPVSQPPVLGMPAPAIEDPVAEIPVNRLPTITPPTTEIATPASPATDGTGTDTDPPAAATTDTAETLPAPRGAATRSAFLRNRMAFDNPEGRPLMSIILVDAGEEGLDSEVLMTFSFPITFAIDPDVPGGTLRAKTFANGGFEVVAMAPGGAKALQPGENPAAVAAVLQGVFGQIPEAVALVDRPDARIQQTPGLPDQVIEALNAGGQGILTYKIGLNSADQLAVKAGLYAGTIYRVLDSERESGAVIKRYLDRAVLEAGKDGHVIVLGRSYPETVTALFSWALSAKANTVSLAPVSAVMMAR